MAKASAMFVVLTNTALGFPTLSAVVTNPREDSPPPASPIDATYVHAVTFREKSTEHALDAGGVVETAVAVVPGWVASSTVQPPPTVADRTLLALSAVVALFAVFALLAVFAVVAVSA
jgi:hypothetical protein